MEQRFKYKLIFDSSEQHVSGYGNPDFGLDGVLAVADELLNAQVLLDPFKEDLDLSAVLVKTGNGHCWQKMIVTQKHQGLAGLWAFESNPSDLTWGNACLAA